MNPRATRAPIHTCFLFGTTVSTHLFQFGEDIDGYPIKVLNERAVRTAAGISP